MILRTKSLFLGICLLARTTFGGETIASFAKQSLGLDLSSVSFGMPAQTNAGYGTVGPPNSPQTLADVAGISWMTNAASGTYNHNFPNRTLRYGFRDGRLTAVRVSINSYVGTDEGNEGQRREKFEQPRKELVRIQEELVKASPGAPRLHNFDDASFHIQYGAMCAPTPESVFLAEIQITPIEKKKAH
jgi:hypothetical protein